MAVINHHGSSFASGHYTLDRRIGALVKRFNDQKVSDQAEFNHSTGYVLPLQKMGFQRSSSIIRKFLQRQSNDETKTVNNIHVKSFRRVKMRPEKSNNSSTSSIMKAKKPTRQKRAATPLSLIRQPAVKRRSICNIDSKHFEIMNDNNFSNPASTYPAGLTKRFLSSLWQLQRQTDSVKISDFWQQHSLQVHRLQQKHVDQWKTQNVKVTFNGKDFHQVWANKPKPTESDAKKVVAHSFNKKRKLKSAVQKQKAEQYAQTKDAINQRRREKCQKQRQKEKSNHLAYLQKMGHEQTSPLYKQPWTAKATKKFYKKINQFQLAQCSECFERWYAPANYKEHKTSVYHCTRCKKELASLSKAANRRKLKVTRFGQANDMQPGPFPPCARNLTQIEQLLVSPIITCMPVYTVRGGSKRINGNCINFVQHTEEIVNVLPRLPPELNTMVTQAAGHEVNNKTFKVNRNRLREFLRLC